MALVCCSFFSGLGHRYPELQGLECSLIDRDPGSKLRPGMAHDLELCCAGLKLLPGGGFNFYCELFHISFIVSAGPELPPRTGVWFGKFYERKTIKRAPGCILSSLGLAVKLVA